MPSGYSLVGNFGSSRLLRHELRTTLHARGLAESHDTSAHQLIGRVAILEMTPLVLARALRQFSGEVKLRTLNALQTVSCNNLMDNYQPVTTREV